MGKKKLSVKKTVSKKQKYASIWHHFFRYLSTVLSVWVLASVAFLVFPHSTNLPCANSISCIKDLSVNVDNKDTGEFMGQKVTPPKIDLSKDLATNQVLGDSTGAEKHIYVDLAKQTLYAFEGDKLIYTFIISSGKWAPTPTGTFHIWIKLRSTTMSGGSGADYYNLPNVEYTMFFYNDQYPKSMGYSTHTAYWHNNFGHPMSHGCINMRREDAKALYDWADPPTTGYTTYATAQNPGTAITIYGTAPLN